MRTLPIIILLSICLLVLTGCFEVETVIHVKRDGSGIVRERVVLKSDMMIMMITMAKKMKGEDDERKESYGLFDEEELRDKAAAMGEGVTYRSGKILTGDDGEGYEATYEFADINTLHVNMMPDFPGETPENEEETENEDEAEPEEKKEELRFEFQKGSPATLIVHVPPVDRNNDDSTEEHNEEDSEQGIQMARMMLKDLKISAVLEVDGTVVESDASFRDKSRIILMDIDFDKLTADENLIRTAMKSDKLSDEETKDLMKKYPGLKIELNKKTTIRFR